MKAGLLHKIAKSYAPLFSNEWKLIGSKFLRYKGDWVQFVTFNASRWDDSYEPGTGCEFLKRSEPATATWLSQGLKHLNGTQKWVKATQDIAPIFDEMCVQFFPPLQGPLEEKEIKNRLTKGLEYHTYAYALCVMASEAGHTWKAQRYYWAFKSAVSGWQYPWVEEQKAELSTCLGLMKSPDKLEAHLSSVRSEKLKALKLLK